MSTTNILINSLTSHSFSGHSGLDLKWVPTINILHPIHLKLQDCTFTLCTKLWYPDKWLTDPILTAFPHSNMVSNCKLTNKHDYGERGRFLNDPSCIRSKCVYLTIFTFSKQSFNESLDFATVHSPIKYRNLIVSLPVQYALNIYLIRQK